MEFVRTGAPINKNLLDEDWVNAAQEQLAEKVGLTKILSSGKSIADTFHSDFELAKITHELVPQNNMALYAFQALQKTELDFQLCFLFTVWGSSYAVVFL